MHFLAKRTLEKSSICFVSFSQEKGKSLNSYTQHFINAYNEVEYPDDEITIKAFKAVMHNKEQKYVVGNTHALTFRHLLHTVRELIDMEEISVMQGKYQGVTGSQDDRGFRGNRSKLQFKDKVKAPTTEHVPSNKFSTYT